MAQKILGEAFAPGAVVGGDGVFAAVVDVEAGVFLGEEVGEFSGADEFGVTEGVKEAVAENFDGGGEVFGGHTVEASVGGEESVGGEDVEMGVEDEVVSALPEPRPLETRIPLWSPWATVAGLVGLLGVFWTGRKLNGMF